MTILLATFALFFFVVILMAILVTIGGRALKGSCGGVAGGSCACRDAGRPEGSCEDDRPIGITPPHNVHR